MTNTPLDQEKVEQLAAQKAQAQMEQLKQDLIVGISGKQPDRAPNSWTDLKEETANLAVERAEERILSKIRSEQEEKEKALKVKEEQEKSQTEAQKKADADREWNEQSLQWREAVEDGLMPAISQDVSPLLDVVQSNSRQLTPEELQKIDSDPGVKAYREVVVLHNQLKSEGKSGTLYRTIQKFLNKKPAGASAPVMGASRAVSTPPAIDYDKEHAENMRSFRQGHR